MYTDKSKWETLSASKESSDIVKLFGIRNNILVNEAKILRIGNDTSDESEMIHMDGIFTRSTVITTKLIGERGLFICSYQGQILIREQYDDIIAYYVIDNEPNEIPKPINLLTIEKLKSIKEGQVFMTGEIENSPEGLNMSSSNIGKKLMWVAKRGTIHDWAIYAHWADKGFDFVLTQGDKVTSKDNIKKLVNCDDEALSMYRF